MKTAFKIFLFGAFFLLFSGCPTRRGGRYNDVAVSCQCHSAYATAGGMVSIPSVRGEGAGKREAEEDAAANCHDVLSISAPSLPFEAARIENCHFHDPSFGTY